jgi:hypothetical protein
MAQNIYPIQLLNDIHNYFPDILYNPGRFRNIGDLLDYIRSVADVNPYSRGLYDYNERQMQRPYNIRPLNTIRAFTPPRTSNIPLNIRQSGVEPDIGITRIEFPLDNAASIMNTILGNLGVSLAGQNLQGFLDTRVNIAPTNEEIENSTVIEVSSENQDNNCAICQDLFEEGQQMRKINYCSHYFHKDCIDVWFRNNVHCPTCRHDIREINSNPPPVPENYRRTNINSVD